MLVLAYLRKSSRIFLVRDLFTKLVAWNTQLSLHKHVVRQLTKSTKIELKFKHLEIYKRKNKAEFNNMGNSHNFKYSDSELNDLIEYIKTEK